MHTGNAQPALIAILQLAYSGERAAAYAYQGHARSVRSRDERARIEQIEQEEWHHRALVGEMLTALGAAPDRRRERRATIIGRTLSVLCHVSGWFLPMYAAGKLESRNVGEYETAARLAIDSRNRQLVDCLLTMAEVEWEHEHYFRERVATHWLTRFVPLWPAIPPRDAIRKNFEHSDAA